MACENSVGSAICSICFEDLKPVTEILQSISACGHVFHELCLQQWLEYCPKRRHCPFCKQNCHLKDPFRLYFQSSENQIDSPASQKILEIETDPAVLRVEVKRLEGKIHNLSSALEEQKKQNVEVSATLHQYKEHLKDEEVKRSEALQEISTSKHMLKTKSEECVELTSQCAKLQERSMALAKELASLKLISDVSLKEDDIRKLALLGNNAKTKDMVDTLVKSLFMRNRIYNDLLAKCNKLGRDEARSSEKLEIALEKMGKLKKRVRELEMITEQRANKALRDIKVPKKFSDKNVTKPAKESEASLRMPPSDNIGDKIYAPLGRGDSVIVVEDDVPETTISGIRHSDSNMKDQKGEDNNVPENSFSFDNHMFKDIKFNISNPTSSVPPFCNGAGDNSLSGGTFRNPGRWSKSGERNKASPSVGGGSSVTGNSELISFGPDGKGGRIKVLRTQHQIFATSANSGSVKRLKLGTKRSGTSSPSQGCLQIEHYFGKPNG